MPSESAKKRQAQKKERRQAGGRRKQPAPTPKTDKPPQNGDVETAVEEEAVAEGACAAPQTSVATVVEKSVAALKLSPLSCTGELTNRTAE